MAVYVGEAREVAYTIPIAYLSEPPYQNLLTQAEKEFIVDHVEGGLTIPCRVDIFFKLTCLSIV